jgi:ATP-dependent helicase HrpA
LSMTVKTTDFKSETLPAHHFMNFKVIDEHGRQLDMGRNLAGLQAEFGGQARESFQRLADKTVIPAATTAAPAQQAAADGRKPSSSNAAIKSHQSAQNSQQKPVTQHENLTSWSFGELPELLEIQQGKQTLIGFPALVDKGSHCDLEVFDDPAEAMRIHRLGLRRLIALQLKDQMKYLEKNIPGLQQMGMQFMALGSQEELRDQIISAGLERAFLQDPLPKNAAEFEARRDEGKTRLGLLVNEIARLAGAILAEYYTLPKKLQGIKAHAQAAQDMQAQMQALIGKRFITETEYSSLSHFPRYLKAINVRLEKLRADPTRDTRLMAEWAQVATPWQRAQKDKNSGKSDPKMIEYRWLLEELRVSLFAQELRTPMPVSVKRLQKVWESMQR